MAILLYVGALLLIPVVYTLQFWLPILWKIYKARKALLGNFPTPDYHWLLGHLHVFSGLNEDELQWHHSLCVKHPRYFVIIIGPTAVLQLNHPETVKQLTKTAEPKPLHYRFLKPWIGDGLLISSGNKWFRNRKLLTPGFHFDVLKAYIGVYNNCVEKLMDRFEKESVRTNQSMDIFKPVGYCALDIILQCAFSSKQDIQEKQEKQVYARTINELGKQVARRTLSPWLYSSFIYYKTTKGKKFRNNCELSHQVADEVIHKRKRELGETDTIEKLSTKRYVDFLDILLLARDEDGNYLTEQEIRDEVETFMFEGHDTTASGTAWLLYNLAKHIDIQSKARKEVDTLLDGRDSDDITWGDMTELPYVTCCIKESLRLHSTVPFIGREITTPLQMDDKIIPAGCHVDINIWNLHHDPAVWNDPMIYDPDRFLPENISKMDSHAFMPFSAGPRNCIGQNFAMNEMKTTVARILRRFEMSLDETKEVQMQFDVVMRSKSGIHLFFKNRQ